jgi:hypothetical protein
VKAGQTIFAENPFDLAVTSSGIVPAVPKRRGQTDRQVELEDLASLSWSHE